MKELTAKEERFCQEYLIDLNGTAAAVRAGYSKRTAYSIANQLLGKEHIQERIAELQAERAKRTKIDQDYVLSKLKAILDTTIKDVLKQSGRGVGFRKLSDLTPEEAAAIWEISWGKTKKIKMYDKLKAIELAMKHLGMLDKKEDQEENTDNSELEDALTGATGTAWDGDDGNGGNLEK